MGGDSDFDDFDAWIDGSNGSTLDGSLRSRPGGGSLTLQRLAKLKLLKGQYVQGGAEKSAPPFLCAEHVRQLEGGSPLDNLMEVKS